MHLNQNDHLIDMTELHGDALAEWNDEQAADIEFVEADLEPHWSDSIPFSRAANNGIRVFYYRTYSAAGVMTVTTSMTSEYHTTLELDFNPAPLTATIHNEAEWAIFKHKVDMEVGYWTYLAGALRSRLTRPDLIGWTVNRFSPTVTNSSWQSQTSGFDQP
jgi:hypothetical protein